MFDFRWGEQILTETIQLYHLYIKQKVSHYNSSTIGLILPYSPLEVSYGAFFVTPCERAHRS